MCAKSLYRWFHARFIMHPGVYKNNLSYQIARKFYNRPLSVKPKFIQYLYMNPRKPYRNWCQKLETGNGEGMLFHIKYKMDKHKDSKVNTLFESVMIRRYSFSFQIVCINLQKQELPNSQNCSF